MVTPLLEVINLYALKKKTVNIGNPAIILQRAYWKPSGYNNDCEWHRNIDNYIRCTREKAQAFVATILRASNTTPSHASTTSTDERGLEIPDVDMSKPADKYDIRLFSSQISIIVSDIKISIIFDKFDEFWSIKTVIDFSYYDGTGPAPQYLKDLNDSLVKLEDILVSRFDTYRDKDSSFNSKEKVIDDSIAVESVISELSHSISQSTSLLSFDLFPAKGTGTPGALCDLDRCIFANFVGFSLGLNMDSSLSIKPRFLPRGKSDYGDQNVFPEGIFATEGAQLFNVINAAWPIATHLNPYDSHVEGVIGNKFEISKISREFTISTLNSNRALYISSLGSMREIESKGIYFPLSYILIWPHRATWEIGRVIDRIHALGLFRLASFFEYEHLEKANDNMRQLIDRMNEGRDVEDISRSFESVGVGIENGLRYRIDWSKYYHSLFKEYLGMIKFGEVVGYEPYDYFVFRKMGAWFGTIESISRRYDHLVERIRSSRDRKISLSIKELLSFAEVGSIIPIAYYSYGLCEHLNEVDFFAGPNRILVKIFGKIIPQHAWIVAWLSITWIYFVWVLCKRFDVFNKRTLAQIFSPFMSAN